jgi:hypothetical protein
VHTKRWSENLKGRDHSEYNNGTDLNKIVWEGVDWIHLAQGKDQWRASVNTVTNLRVP